MSRIIPIQCQWANTRSFDSPCRLKVVVGFVLLTLVAMSGCYDTASEPKILFFAAASSNEAISEICQQYESKEEVIVRTSFAGSSTLATQILNGAKADLFLSANLQWVNNLKKNGAVESVNNVIGNQLVVISSTRSLDTKWIPAQLKDLADVRVKQIAMADPESVPAGIYAKNAMEKVKLWDQIDHKLVYGTDVRQTLAQVENAAVDFGVVYSTDANISRNVQVVFEIPLELTGPIEYGLVLTAHGHANPNSRHFFEYLSSKSAEQVFKKHGFLVPGAAK